MQVLAMLRCPMMCVGAVRHCAAVQAAFKSDYIALATTAGSAMAELLCSKQALSEVNLELKAMSCCVQSV